METQISIHHPFRGPVKEYQDDKVRAAAKHFIDKLGKRKELARVEIFIGEPHNPAGKTTAYEITVKAKFADGGVMVGKTDQEIARSRHVGLETGVRKAFREVQRQLDKK